MRLTTLLRVYGGHAVLLAVLVSSAFSQSARPDFNRPRTIDVQNYSIRVRFDRKAKKVFGETVVSLKPLADGLEQVELDSVGIDYSSVTLLPENRKLDYKLASDKILIKLPKPLGRDESADIRFVYTAVPKKGIYFVDPLIENGAETRSAQIWTQGEAEEARYWFPSFDFPSDKATSEQFITADADETVVGNGEFRGRVDNGDGTSTWHFKMPVPHATYLVSFVIGTYVSVKDKFGSVPLAYNVYPGKEELVPKAFARTPDVLRVYEELTGVKFPFNKYDQTIVADFQFGGMENITATTLADNEVFLANFTFGAGTVEDLVSHEAAHSWFGNLVTCKNWAELWLNEGFATFMEAAYRERTYGRENYLLKIRRDAAIYLTDDAVNENRNGLFNENAGNASALFDRPATTYNKGGAVLYMLREEIGDAAFWKGVNIYLNRFKFGSVESGDLRRAMEESSGRDLKWFFDQWVYGVGFPQLEIRPSYDRIAKKLSLTVSQTQKSGKQGPEAFALPIEVTFSSGGVVQRQTLNIKRRSESFTFDAATLPTDLKIDPAEKIILKLANVSKIKIAAPKRGRQKSSAP